MEDRRADGLCRHRQLSAAAERPALRRGGLAHARLHGPVGAAAARSRHVRGDRLSRPLPDARLPARPAGYGIARMRAHKSAVVILIARITPGLSYLIPLFLLFQWLGLLGTLWPQIIIQLVVTVPIVIWIMIGYFETTPMELEEAALIDGAMRWQVFRHVALPIARPGMAVAFILAVIFSWNNFVFGIVLAGRETRTLPVAVYNMISFDQLSWGPLAAAALIVSCPVLRLAVCAERQSVAGLTAGAVKGG